MNFVVTNDQIEQFRIDGFLVVENLVDEKTIAQLHTRFDRLFHGDFETGTSPDEVNWQEGDSDPGLTRQICNAWKSDRCVAATVLHRTMRHQSISATRIESNTASAFSLISSSVAS